MWENDQNPGDLLGTFCKSFGWKLPKNLKFKHLRILAGFTPKIHVEYSTRIVSPWLQKCVFSSQVLIDRAIS